MCEVTCRIEENENRQTFGNKTKKRIRLEFRSETHLGFHKDHVKYKNVGA